MARDYEFRRTRAELRAVEEFQALYGACTPAHEIPECDEGLRTVLARVLKDGFKCRQVPVHIAEQRNPARASKQ